MILHYQYGGKAHPVKWDAIDPVEPDLSWGFGDYVYDYDLTLTESDLTDFYDCTEDEAQLILEGEDVPGYPSFGELEDDSEFVDYMTETHEDEARAQWEEDNG